MVRGGWRCGILLGMNTIVTTVNREYALRFLGVAVLFLGLTGWFLYDGLVGYPAKNAAFLPVGEELAKQEMTPTDWMNTAKTGTAPLITAFQEKGMEAPSKVVDTFNSWIRAEDPLALQVEAAQKTLQTPLYSDHDIRAQFISAVVGVLATLVLLAIVALRMLTRYTLTEEALSVTFLSKTATYPLSTLSGLEDSQWEKRGIATAQFGSASVTMDAWHHQGVKAIVEALKGRLPTA